ncbi:O-antigen ligase family protein [Rhodoferax sp.]|uniref:O-antigen ligase family protein n=1 Tax=Rhodoferax sp. TaxID=50421 RepID=UPI0025F87225|nr:O-antigen ligase family protein [Rhodoferax sp.]MCM2295572.1 O-antigen ligase family protein [Rhodoferax sp.]
MTPNRLNIRVAIAVFAAASAALPIVFVSLSKVLLVIAALIALLLGKPATVAPAAWRFMWTPRVVLMVLFAFAVSLFWTTAPMDQALGTIGKYGKFLVIPTLLVLVRTHREATWVLLAFAVAQVFLLISSWLLYFNVPVAWATSKMALTRYAVFVTYLDQGIMSAVVAAIFWHLKPLAPSRPLFYVLAGISLLALGNAFFLFVGRTGHVVGVVMISMAIFWALPRRYRLVTLVVPPVLILLAVLSFENVAQRFVFTKTEISNFSSGVGAATSEDNRLDFWKGSVETIAERPLTGFGVGSWATEYNKLQKLNFPGHKDLGIGSNPHQEYLLWGVQLGVGGILLLLGFLSSIMKDLLKMDEPIARAGQSVLVALVISCLFNSSLYDAYIGYFFCLSLGVLLVYGIHGRHRPQMTE